MAFSERPYLSGYSNSFPRGVRWLLIANFAAYIVFFLAVHTGYEALFVPFYLHPGQVIGSLAVWQPFTYMFLHDPNGFTHILFNMLTLWMFGADVERTWGTKRFVEYYFLCGVGAAICVVLANLFVGSGGTTIGASGAIFGVLLAFGMLFPDRQILFSFLFPIKAKYAVMIFGAIAFLSSFAAPGGPVSHLAHLGGMAFGYFYIRSHRRRSPLRGPQTSFWRNVRGQYEEWKLQRARRKFKVYLKKPQDRDRDPYVH